MADSDADDAPDPDEFADPSPHPDGDPRLAVLTDALQDRGVTRLEVHYQGSGDAGSVEEVEYTPADALIPEWLDDALRDVAEDYCPSGYEDNEGGYGTLTVHPALGLAALEHRDRYQDSEPIDAPAARLPRRLRRELARLGVTALTAAFDGYGDSGQLDSLTAEPESAVLGDDLREALEGFLLGLLPGGWEINEGSFGTFTADVQTGRVEAEAAWRVGKDSEARVTRWRWRAS